MNQDACSAVIARTTSDRLRGDALNYRGLIYSRTGRLADAEADFTESIRLLPSSSAARNNRANVYRKQGRYDLMMSDLEAAKVAKPGSPTSYNNHANLLVEEGDYAAALPLRSEDHTSELQSLRRISYAVFCLKRKQNKTA